MKNISRAIRLAAMAILATVSLAASAANFIPATDKQIAYVGRVSLQSGRYARFGYPGVQIRAVFQGTSLRMKMKPNSGYYMVELDNRKPFKIQCPEKDSVMSVAANLPAGEHRCTVTFCTEGLYHRPQFWGFLLDDGCVLIGRPFLPERKIEFIGNSITCGFGIEGATGKEKFRYSTQNQYYTYDAITARNLNAQCVLVARSGIGVYRNCGGKVQGDTEIMPAVYPYTLFGTKGEKWDFRRYTPDVVCINLGTNDTSGPGYDTTLLYNGFVDFYKTVRSHYPKAKIVLLSGTMIRHGSKRELELNGTLDKVAAEARRQGDSQVYRFDMTPEDGTMGWGSCYHPSMKRHARMAEELTAYLREITGWK